MAGRIDIDGAKALLLSGTGVVNCKNGVLGTAGVATDTELVGVIIAVNAAAVTLSITGLTNDAAAAATMLLTGSATVDTYMFPVAPFINHFGAFTFQASVANKVWLLLRAYYGPERTAPI